MHRKAVFVALSTLLMFVMSGGIFPTIQAQSNDPAPTVQTDKRAYLPGSQVIASGSGWSNGVFVELKYTEIATTDPQGTLDGPVTVHALTDANGSFSSTGAPSDTYTTPTNHKATVTVLLTATGVDASGNPSVSVQSLTFTNGVIVTTDDNHYPIGQPMTIKGAGFTPFSTVTVTILLPNHTFDDPLTAPVIDDGTFEVVYDTPPSMPGRYKITATDGVYSAETATTSADAIDIDFKQCANNDPSNTGANLGKCHWINSILQGSNGTFYEGMSTLQRMILDQIPVSTNNGLYRMQFHLDAVKNGHHAYDFITTWDDAINATNELAPGGVTQPVNLYPSGPPSPYGPAPASIPYDLRLRTTEANTIACADAPNSGQSPTLRDVCLGLRDSSNIFVTYADLDPATMPGILGNSVAQRLEAYQNRYQPGAPHGQHAIKFYSNAPIDAAVLGLSPTQPYDAQGNSNWTLLWHSNGTPTRLLIEFGAHIAVGDDTVGYGVGYGPGLGAADINGGPYHVSVDLFDNGLPSNDDDVSLGSQDNQLKGADILVPPRLPEIVSQASTNGTVAPGTSVTDTVTVTGNIGTPTGSVTFFLCGPGADPTTGCTTGGTNIGTVALTAGTAISAPVAPTAPGFYCFRAEYSGGSPYLPDSHTNNTTECFTVGTASTTLVLASQTPAGANQPVGTLVTIVVTETNTGTLPLSNVSVTGGGKCATFTGGATTLAVGASTQFTCTFTVTAGANAWFADGHGTDANGNQVPATGEHVEGSVQGLTSSTTLVLASQTPAGAVQPVGQLMTIVVTETNTGTTSLSGVNVTGGGKCVSFTGGATTLAPGASTNFTCTFTTVAGANAWFADGHGTDQFGTPVPSAGEHAEGSVTGLTSSTTLVLASQTPAGAVQPVGQLMTIVVTETNTGTTSLSGVNVTGGGKCVSFTGGATTLAPGASTNFTCTFTTVAGANAWSADGHGTDQFGTPVPSAGEHAEGSVTGLTSSTTLVLASQTPAGAVQPVGQLMTIVVTETNTGTTSLSGVNVTGGGKCVSFTGGATTLAPGASTNFTCTFTTVAGANAWFADGHGTDQFGTPVPSAGEHAEGSVTGLTSSTTLVLASQTPAGAVQPIGQLMTIVVTETNTGTTSLSGVSVSGGGKCVSFTGGATTLAPGASTNFTCTFTTVAGVNAWFADGHGTDQFGTPVPSAGEHAEGSVTGLASSTSLVLASQTPAGAVQPVGQLMTIVVTETNTGTTSLSGVNVTGGGKCVSFTGGATTLAPGASTNFTCTFTTVAGANAWFADGHGTDQFGTPVPDAGEHAEGSVQGLTSSTSLTLKSQTPAGANLAVGTNVTIVVTETNTGTTSLSGVSVSGGGKCVSFTGGATTLAAGAATDFTCTFTTTAGANAWFGDGHGTDQFGTPVPAAGEHVEGSVNGVDAWIEINPPTGLNPIGSNHVLTITVHSVGGNLAAGTATASIIAGPGLPAVQNCNYAAGGTVSSCQVIITSLVAGVSQISASSAISVAGVVLNRTTNGSVTPSGQQNSGPAQKAWFDTHVQLTKLVNGGTPSASDPAFQFQLWTGLSATTPGTLLETKTTTPGTNNVLVFTTSLVPGAQYQMCELVVNGYTPDFTGFGSFNPGGNNPGYFCFNFTANTSSGTLLITVNNIHETGLALTIGFWKNHASCASSNGNQEPVTDQVLQLFEPAGFTIGILTLHDTNPDPDVASDCLPVVNLLNKTTINGGKKMASDPLFNMAAQLVAYYLNVQNGASECSAVADAAQALLVAHLFDGLTHTALTKEQAAYANALNGLLDNYNNNNGCGVPPTAPNPL